MKEHNRFQYIVYGRKESSNPEPTVSKSRMEKINKELREYIKDTVGLQPTIERGFRASLPIIEDAIGLGHTPQNIKIGGNKMKEYAKLTDRVMAIQVFPGNIDEILKLKEVLSVEYSNHKLGNGRAEEKIVIETTSGVCTPEYGAWLVREEYGHIFTIKDTKFREQYGELKHLW